ncbi:MAG TPA: hypothetical protein VH120_13310, partial [Gemmataceae bacterium]|nr:hypothetical protein [Gemmataceae bacterium]
MIGQSGRANFLPRRSGPDTIHVSAPFRTSRRLVSPPRLGRLGHLPQRVGRASFPAGVHGQVGHRYDPDQFFVPVQDEQSAGRPVGHRVRRVLRGPAGLGRWVPRRPIVFHGPGTLVKAGAGALTLTNTGNTFSNLVINGGSIQTANDATLGPNPTITVNAAGPGSASLGRFVLGPGGVDDYFFAIDDATGAAGPKPDALGHVSGWGLVQAVRQPVGTATTPGDFTWTATPADKLTVSLDTLLNPT